jgi:hypothetical protein
MKAARLLIFIGSVLLLLSGVMHAYGYTVIIPMARAANVSPGLMKLLEGLWFMFSAEFILLCPIIIWISQLPRARWLVLLCATIPAVATAIIFWSVGVFIGSIGFAIGTALIILGALLMPASAKIS